MIRFISWALCLPFIALLAGCSTTDVWPVATYQSVAWNVDPVIPDAVRAPTGHVLLGHLIGRGTATFALQPDPSNDNRLVWVMTEDQGGDLIDEAGKVIAHRDGTHWVGNDGTRVTTEQLAGVKLAGRVPWTLSRATGGQGGGLLGSAEFVQQIHTVGGPPKSAPIEAGAKVQAQYSADYYFYGAVAAQTRVNRGVSYGS